MFIPIKAYESFLDENCELKSRVLLILKSFLLPDEVQVEDRTDNYIITSADVGVKYRKGTKLEMKLRTETFPGGVEHWVKNKLKGKHPIEALTTHLSSQGYAHVEKIVSMVKDNRTIMINKRRTISSLDTWTAELEVCQVQISGENVQAAMPSQWISIAVESTSPDSILSAVSAHSDLKELIILLVAINNHAIENSIPQLISFICGYPFFVQYLAGEGTRELGDAVRMLEQFV